MPQKNVLICCNQCILHILYFNNLLLAFLLNHDLPFLGTALEARFCVFVKLEPEPGDTSWPSLQQKFSSMIRKCDVNKQSDVKQKLHHITFLNDIIFAFTSQPALVTSLNQ